VELDEFRAALDRWLDEEAEALVPPHPAGSLDAHMAHLAKVKRLAYDAGFMRYGWPERVGGLGGSNLLRAYLAETLTARDLIEAGLYTLPEFMVPTLLDYASPALAAEMVPRVLRGDEVWCQGFSEPDAGSDLASLRCRAVRDGDDYVVTGQKIWTSYAEVADFCELLVRTGEEGSKHKGITWLAMAMDSPGIEVRPLRTIAGASEFAQLFLDGVRVPLSNRVGEENDGWRVTMVTLSFERGTAFVGELLQSMEMLRQLRALARRTGAWDDPGIRHRVGQMGAELDALWALTRRTVSQAARSGVPGLGGSVFKLAFSELRQRQAQLGVDLLGAAGLALEDLQAPDGSGTLGNARLVEMWVWSFSRTIAAGTSQIQRNIVAERILGLPKG